MNISFFFLLLKKNFLFLPSFIFLCFLFHEEYDEVDLDVLQVLEPTFIEDVDEQDTEHEGIFAFLRTWLVFYWTVNFYRLDL